MVYFLQLLHPLSPLPLPLSASSFVHRFPSLHMSDPFLQIVFPVYFSFVRSRVRMFLFLYSKNVLLFSGIVNVPRPIFLSLFRASSCLSSVITFLKRTDKPLDHSFFRYARAIPLRILLFENVKRLTDSEILILYLPIRPHDRLTECCCRRSVKPVPGPTCERRTKGINRWP